MFTGIVEETGKVISLKKGAGFTKLTVLGEKIFDDLKIGDSVAVNGVCLTAALISGNIFTADVMSETLNRSSLGFLRAGSRVNLERAMLAQGRFGGHIVAGHVDGMGTVTDIHPEGNAVWYKISAPSEIMKYIVEKGSVAIDGISLTVAEVSKEDFSVSIIPHTAAETTLSLKKTGDKVNLENDIIGKYVERLMNREEKPKKAPESAITAEFLIKNGF